jgi:hypothetical protein
MIAETCGRGRDTRTSSIEVLRRTACAGSLSLAILAAPAWTSLEAQRHAAQVILRPPHSEVEVRRGAATWNRAVQHAFLHDGDSLAVASGSAELLYVSGVRRTYSAGAKLRIGLKSEDSQGVRRPVIAAALAALIEMLPGGAKGLRRERPLESRIGRMYFMAPTSILASVGGRPARIEFPIEFPDDPWLIRPETDAVRWNFFDSPPFPYLKVEIYPATDSPGCARSGPLLHDEVVQAPELSLPYSRARLQPSSVYRIEVGVADEVRAGCLRTLSVEAAAAVAEQLNALRQELALESGGKDEIGAGMLEAGILMRHGLHMDALLRIDALVRQADDPQVPLDLWLQLWRSTGAHDGRSMWR